MKSSSKVTPKFLTVVKAISMRNVDGGTRIHTHTHTRTQFYPWIQGVVTIGSCEAHDPYANYKDNLAPN